MIFISLFFNGWIEGESAVNILNTKGYTSFPLEQLDQNRENSLYFSLLTGIDHREQFAADCIHRHLSFPAGAYLPGYSDL